MPGFTAVNDYETKIDFNNFLMHLIPPRSHLGLKTKLRRLSTIALVKQPSEIMQTRWTWYWKENGNVWFKYENDHSVRSIITVP